MKKVLINLGLVMGLMLTLVCGTAQAETSKEALNNYITLSMSGDLEKAYNYLAKPVKDKVAYPQYQKTLAFTQHPLTKMLLKDLKTDILDVKESGNNATAKVKQTMPNFEKIVPAIPTIAKNNPNVKNEQEMLDAINKHFGGTLPITSYDYTYKLTKENNEWKIFPPQFPVQ